jgi:hypothetical protein
VWHGCHSYPHAGCYPHACGHHTSHCYHCECVPHSYPCSCC